MLVTLPVSIWLRCSPSDKAAARDPTKTYSATFGYTNSVAIVNCQNVTASIDWVKGCQKPQLIDQENNATENNILLHTQGGIGDIRMRIIKGRPLAR